MTNQATLERPAPPPGKAAQAGPDPVTLEVVRNKLEGIANEMESTLLRSSFSPIVKEGLDASASLFTTAGESLAQACAVPIHLATLIPIVETLLREYPLDTMRDGDIYIMNDPYLGGTHLPDIALVAPVFVDGRVIAMSATMTHHQDVGGMTPGSIPTNATEIYQEGIRIPPLKLFDAGEINQTLVSLLRLNVRIPDTFMGDINAQIAACRIGARRLVELTKVYDIALLESVFAALLTHSEALTRAQLDMIPAGVYRYVDWLDNDGIDLDQRVRIEVAVTVGNGAMHVDFTGSSAQLRGPFNCVKSGSQAAAYFAVRALTDPEIPTNAGCFRPVSLHLPKGSLVNPEEPAPVGSRTATIKRITGCILGAFKEALPDKVPADSAGVLLALAFGGKQADGKSYVVGELITGGSGASRRCDGVDVVETDASNCMNLPVEALELEAPIRVHRLELRPDSGGAGTFRGGLGLVKEFELLGDSAVFTHRGERHYCPAQGSAGGASGACEHSVIVRASGEVEEIPSKQVADLRKGDRVIVQTPGGGGYGDPAKRERQAVRADIADGKLSAAQAEALYGFTG
ncbi:hydantoinase B/oxoprolinase family protein [Bordetella sp. BOR01]|uniref:hydantoinase B/oxoprolinase family protein n=1 Tax=Bordetella sp. BOR01 TaxID=2854779 RepID=UPI001C491D3A|nr:hydantoinase B/oxoprolinase family protein [Bordetella sp. BOR01]MBV7485136.1 hydantoinase B/oxoprolinase family protein [Bordetella sp. BOR01]